VHIALLHNIIEWSSHSTALTDYSQRAEDSVAAKESRAPAGLFFPEDLTRLCVQADENILKVNGPLRLSSPSYWLHVAAMTLLLQSESHSHSPKKPSLFYKVPGIPLAYS